MASPVEQFLAMLAAERGAAANTLAAYRRDLEGAEELLGDLASADREALASLAGKWRWNVRDTRSAQPHWCTRHG